MARRLATVYVKTHIRLTEAEMIEFIQLFKKNRVQIEARVYENGNHEVVLESGKGQAITLNFARHEDMYVFDGSFCFYQSAYANVMRKAISKFKGSALVHREYVNFTMEYCYERGIVVSIVERRPGGRKRVVYRYKNKLAELEAMYKRRDVEQDIARVKEQINRMLDIRRSSHPSRIPDVDAELAALSRRLFALEA